VRSLRENVHIQLTNKVASYRNVTTTLDNQERRKVMNMTAKQRNNRDAAPQEISVPQATGELFQSSAARQEEIRRRAYEVYLERGEQPGGELNDWLQAENESNKALVLEAFDTLFNQRDYANAERYWSPNYIQHSAHIGPGRDGLFNLIKSIPPTLKYEPGTIVAEGNFVIVHGRFSGIGLPVNWIAADILRIKDGVLVEHWDVIQDEATEEESKSGLPMFGDKFGERSSTAKQ
jgi:predicted SnoaL-like aldol condensation-catalyzing enzyme